MKKEFLIERMSVENVSKIEKYCKKYPNTGNYLMNELATKEYWTGLTYESVATLNDILDCGWRPTDMGNLFKR